MTASLLVAVGDVLRLFVTDTAWGRVWNSTWPLAIIALGVALLTWSRGFRKHRRPRPSRLEHHRRGLDAPRRRRGRDRPRGKRRR